jgi:hypothetical protein
MPALTVAVCPANEVRVLEVLAADGPSSLFPDMNKHRKGATYRLNRLFAQPVQFASIRPHSLAGEATVDLDALAIGHPAFMALANRTADGNTFL